MYFSIIILLYPFFNNGTDNTQPVCICSNCTKINWAFFKSI
ncbi:hypothetical protein L798_08214 [Zootermopsis nevadensis]|uniref:Uncharacterized protein n=1 Tax=Zootermopsis nevadensis TaxID=136037 RepID=A0A067RFU9_ZOONE|nr:hypothetical protein L798_08214 [Zootermopsis nevadensis]